MHLSARVAVRHLLMQDPAPGGHPLHVPRAKAAPVAEAVGVIDRAFQHIGDRLDPPVRMPGEAFLEILRPLVAEIVEKQEGVQFGRVLKAEGAVQFDAGTFQRGNGAAGLEGGSEGHRCLLRVALSHR